MHRYCQHDLLKRRVEDGIRELNYCECVMRVDSGLAVV
jgi:hypothetical protein